MPKKANVQKVQANVQLFPPNVHNFHRKVQKGHTCTKSPSKKWNFCTCVSFSDKQGEFLDK